MKGLETYLKYDVRWTREGRAVVELADGTQEEPALVEPSHDGYRCWQCRMSSCFHVGAVATYHLRPTPGGEHG